ncbi:YbaN family protein [Sphingomonas sp. LHG3406-1]|uniref:YbaN family protein n=1 Tax=Sphingomonas sp. LHG3406-1 TaxID=2804617 RepID=UPI00260B0EC1|nr:YbaN family protein [Sphingomonas sp. LHG3406-1]
MRILYLALGFVALALGFIGLFLPLLPTVPFVILAAFLFSKGSKRLEARLVGHPRFGPAIRAWRANGSISRRGKRSAYVALAASAAVGLWLLPWPLMLVPALVGVTCAAWISRRPEETA